MKRNPKEVERAFRRADWQALARGLKQSWVTWAVLVALLGAYGYYSVMPRSVAEIVAGTATAAHRPASWDNSEPVYVIVRLDPERTVSVPLPSTQPYRAGAQVEVAVIRGDWPPHPVKYRFVRYREIDARSG